jgi:hypothetical protein
MAAIWTVRNGNGEVLENFLPRPASRLDESPPTRYDAFRLHVSSSYAARFSTARSRISLTGSIGKLSA